MTMYSMLALGITLLWGATPASAFVTTYRWGYVGPMLNEQPNWCFTDAVATGQTQIGRTPRYPYVGQRIWALPSLYIWDQDQSLWVLYRLGTWQSQWVAPGYMVTFPSQTFWNLPHNYYYRVHVKYRWTIHGIKVGEVHDTFNSPNEYNGMPGFNDQAGYCGYSL